MPNFDRSGPQGAGPMTGRGLGRCGRGRGNRAGGAGLGQGLAWRRRGGGGRGRGFGTGYGRAGGEEAMPSAQPMVDDTDTMTPTERRTVLKAERNRLKARLGEVEETLKAIGREKAEDDEA